MIKSYDEYGYTLYQMDMYHLNEMYAALVNRHCHYFTAGPYTEEQQKRHDELTNAVYRTIEVRIRLGMLGGAL